VPAVTIFALLYAGIEDLRFREVRSEFIWIAMIVIGLVMNTLYVIFAADFNTALLKVLLTVVIGFVLGFLFFFLGVWGGADTKALWALSILTPVYPLQILENSNVLGLEIANVLIIDASVFAIIINSGLVAIIYPVVLIAKNTVMAMREPLFDEVRGSTSEKIRCFMFGYKKRVQNISADKLHYDFLEKLIEHQFRGTFEGDFTGRLDGTFLGSFLGELQGEFHGTITGQLLPVPPESTVEQSYEELIALAKKCGQVDETVKDETDEVIDIVTTKYRKTFHLDKDIQDSFSDSFLNFTGKYTGPLSGYFIGQLEGVFEGTFSGKVVGNLTGDYLGDSPKGKLTGKLTNKDKTWQLTIRIGLEEEEQMEKRQLRTLWQLQAHRKKSVWVTPGIPFVFLMLIGYILYIIFGNIALLLFVI
jgi:hypothetical protein